MSRFSVTEPHPSVPKSGTYLYGGRGGAGNYKRYESSQLSVGPDATGPASLATLSKNSSRRFAGVGGAGNYQSIPSELPMFQFDEELKRRENVAPIYHVGRGGAGNLYHEISPRSQRVGSADSASSTSSTVSRHSLADGLNRLARKISKH